MQRLARILLIAIEFVILTALILGTRCTNYQDIFVGGNIYYTDADCYARMMRVRMCAEHPGLVLRHHDFENFPQGTTPHTTVPLDYLIVSLSILLKPFTAQPIDLVALLSRRCSRCSAAGSFGGGHGEGNSVIAGSCS